MDIRDLYIGLTFVSLLVSEYYLRKRMTLAEEQLDRTTASLMDLADKVFRDNQKNDRI